jgi:LysR family transcriptional activator of nhaA
MAHLNYKHLRYFWTVARLGSIAKAAAALHLTSPSISAQLRELEGQLGVSLFRRLGRGLELTEQGRQILRYAEEIFTLGDELLEAVRTPALLQRASRPPFRIGIADSVAKSVVQRVLAPALQISEPVRLICREGRLNMLLGELAVHRLDLVIADRPLPAGLHVRGYSHLLGASDLMLFATGSVLAQCATHDFPQLLDGAPLLLPGEDVALRARIEHWLSQQRLHPLVVAEFDDSALLTAFGRAGAGLFFAPSAIAADLCAAAMAPDAHQGQAREQQELQMLGRIGEVQEQLYAITSERRLTHPASLAISAAARSLG